jgi:hypothetical protein
MAAWLLYTCLQSTQLQQQLSKKGAALADARAQVERMEVLVQVGSQPFDGFYTTICLCVSSCASLLPARLPGLISTM